VQLSEEGKCSVCGSAAKDRCSLCKSAWYCGRACQVKDWSKHKPICTLLSAELKAKAVESKAAHDRLAKQIEHAKLNPKPKTSPSASASASSGSASASAASASASSAAGASAKPKRPPVVTRRFNAPSGAAGDIAHSTPADIKLTHATKTNANGEKEPVPLAAADAKTAPASDASASAKPKIIELEESAPAPAPAPATAAASTTPAATNDLDSVD
jgi:hypothetical protein